MEVSDEQKLTPKQREWLELSKKIGPGPMTRTERESLERVYKEMLPREQQELFEYIRTHFGEQEKREDEQADPIAEMERRIWHAPSKALRSALSRTTAKHPREKKPRS
jgi:hypothetical protein